jgi:DNA-binding transcriptional MocR family regulator
MKPGASGKEQGRVALYQRLAGELAQSIASGVLLPGEKIPSVRAMCRQRRLSPATVLQAYGRLEAGGLIEARPRSGYVVSARPDKAGGERAASQPAPGSQTLDVSELVFEALEAIRDRRVGELGSAFPNPALFPLPTLAKCLSTAARRLDPWKTVEDLPPGCRELRRQIARRYLGFGARVGVDEIVITAGAMEALNLCLQAVTRPGDIVAVESPAFYAQLQAVERLGLRAVEIPTHPRDGVELDGLERALREHDIKACWFMPTFHNPLGSLMPADRKQALVEMLAARKVPLIEDDVYAELYFGSAAPPPAKAYDRAGLVMHCSSFSKCLAPGYRIGWAALGRFARQVAQLKLASSITTNVPAQEALARYLSLGGYDHHLRRLRRFLQARQADMLQALRRDFPPGTRISEPLGGYFLWVELPEPVDALSLHRRAVQQGIGFLPGPVFSARREFGNCLRLNYGHAWTPQLARAVARLGRMAAG